MRGKRRKGEMESKERLYREEGKGKMQGRDGKVI